MAGGRRGRRSEEKGEKEKKEKRRKKREERKEKKEGGIKPPLQREKAPASEGGRYKSLFEVDQNDFWGGADPQWWTPGAGAAGGVNEEVAEALEAVGVGAEDA